MLSIQNEELFKQSLNNGVNLLTGAGFSVLAKNRMDEMLPLVPSLIGKICNEFDYSKYSSKSLSWISKQIKRKNDKGFNQFLKKMYTVDSFDPAYECLSKVNIKNILTTNIDDLPEKIFNNFEGKYLNDAKLNGVLDSSETNIYKLHGSVNYSFTEEMLFSTEELSGAFLRDNSFWSAAQIKHHSYPTIFWGINVNDPNIIDLINTKNFGDRPSAQNWILIRRKEEYDIDAETYQEEGFFIIRGDTEDLLKYIRDEYSPKKSVTVEGKEISEVSYYFDSFLVENILRKQHPARPVILFYQGDVPRWSDIIEEKLFKLSYYNKAQNDLISKKHIHITGIHGSGKSTMLMQLAASKVITGTKFFFEQITVDQARKFSSEFNSKSNIVVFLDNLSSNLPSFEILMKMNNIKIVSAERDVMSFNIRTIDYSSENTSVIDISDISQGEINNICQFMMKPIQNFKFEKTSLFEIVSRLWFNTKAQNRIKQIVNNLPEKLLEFYTINTYARYCGIACSMDMLLSYYTEEDDIGYTEIFEFVGNLRSAIDDENYFKDAEQDYFTLRSQIFSEFSVKAIHPKVLGRVIRKFHKNIHKTLIHNFYIFKKRAWNADIIKLAFPNFKDGIAFYEDQLKHYIDPFIKHQYALYLSRNHKVNSAWRIIEEAYNDTSGRIFSINNTHAMFLFERNIDKDEDEYGTVESMLIKSFDELELCLKKDASTGYHVVTYAKHAKRFHNRYHNEKSSLFMKKAIKFVKEELSNKKYKPYKVFNLLKTLNYELPKVKI
jgi:hypothetical protein